MSLALQCDNCGTARSPMECLDWVAVISYPLAAGIAVTNVEPKLAAWRHFCSPACAGQWLSNGMASIVERAST